MQKNKVNYHIFQNCDSVFESLLEGFNKTYCEHRIVSGTAFKNIFFDAVKFDFPNQKSAASIQTFLPFFLKKIYSSPFFIKILSESDDCLRCECRIHYNYNHKKCYMFQNMFPIKNS